MNTSPGNLGSGHNNNFNFLRLALAITVLASHSAEIIDGNQSREIFSYWHSQWSAGAVAVGGFFLLSGYLILQSWERNPKLGPFLKKRVLRIAPAFWVAFAISVFVVGPLGALGTNYFSELSGTNMLSQALLLRSPATPPTFQGQPYPVVNGSMWTIEYEFRCYLLLAAFGLCGITRRRWLWLSFTLLLILMARNPSLQRFFYMPGGNQIFCDHAYFVRFLSFFWVGGCFFLFRDMIRFPKPGPRKVFVIGCLLVGLIAGMRHERTCYLTLISVGAYLLFTFAFSRFPRLDRINSGTDFSYGLYLYGWSAQKIIHWYFPSLNPWALFTTALPVAAGCGFLSWHLIEKHFLRRKNSGAITSSVEPKVSAFSGLLELPRPRVIPPH